jgi:hypothetical protein
MTNQLNNITYYEIHAQYSSEFLIIKNILMQNYFVKSAKEILSDAKLLAGFSPQQAALIGVIAGMAINE